MVHQPRVRSPCTQFSVSTTMLSQRGMSSQVPQVKADEMKIKHDDVNRVLNDVRALKGKQDHMSSKLENVKR